MWKIIKNDSLVTALTSILVYFVIWFLFIEIVSSPVNRSSVGHNFTYCLIMYGLFLIGPLLVLKPYAIVINIIAIYVFYKILFKKTGGKYNKAFVATMVLSWVLYGAYCCLQYFVT